MVFESIVRFRHSLTSKMARYSLSTQATSGHPVSLLQSRNDFDGRSPDGVVYCESQGRLSWIEHLRGSRGNPQLISRKYVLTSAQNVQSMSGCLRRRES